MKTQGEGQLLRIYIGESDRWEGRPLYEAIVRAAREQGLAGATAFRGIEGFGASSRIHTVKVLHLSEDLPVVVEVADRPEQIAAFMPTIDKMVGEGMVTLERVNLLFYRQSSAGEPPDGDELQLEDSAEIAGPPNAPSSTSSMSDQSRKVIDSAREAAAHSRRPFIDSVDVMLALLAEPTGITRRVLADLKIDITSIERSLRDEVSRESSFGEFLAALETKSAAEARWLGHADVETEHLLLALCEIRPSAATDVLMRLGVQPRDVCEVVLQKLDHQDDWQRWLADHPDM
jgi:PII-like signaling protein